MRNEWVSGLGKSGTEGLQSVLPGYHPGSLIFISLLVIFSLPVDSTIQYSELQIREILAVRRVL